jgi:hypothetical protein
MTPQATDGTINKRRESMKHRITALACMIVLSGCASKDLTNQQQQVIAECEASGGLYKMIDTLVYKPDRCLSAGELARLDAMEMACVQSGGRPYTESKRSLSNGAAIYGGCGSRQPREPIVFTKSSVPDVEVGSYKPTTCRTTVNGNTADTRCF